jgi:hypothetical protein
MKENNIHFSQFSMADDFGRVFFKEGKVFRAIYNEKKEFCLEFLSSPLFNELSIKNLIPKTEIADFNIEGFDLVLEHEKLLETYQHEWSFDMFKDAALMLLELNNICNKYGYELKDGHPYNILFKGTNPIYVDLGSIIIKQNEDWVAYNEFIEAFAIPLLFWSEGKTYIVRKLLEGYPYKMHTIPEKTIGNSGILNLLDYNLTQYNLNLKNKVLFTTHKNNKLISILVRTLNAFNRRILGAKTRSFYYQKSYIPLGIIMRLLNNSEPPELISSWQDYHQKVYKDSETSDPIFRFSRILTLIEERGNQIDSVIDLAGNAGYFCSLLGKNSKISKILLSDYDENAINSAYNRFKSNDNLKKINVVLLNFMAAPDMIGTSKRLKADIALAMAVTHHLLLTNKYSISAIFEKIKSYSNKYVFIEFMPLGLWGGEVTYPVIPDWYNIEWFRNEFCKFFDLLSEEKLDLNRVLFVGKF